jgi:hypothetical protein
MPWALANSYGSQPRRPHIPEPITIRRELFSDPEIVVIDDVEVAVRIEPDAERGFHHSGDRVRAAPTGEKRTGGAEFLDAVRAGVGDEYVAVLGDDAAERVEEQTGRVAGAAPLEHEDAVGGEPLDSAVERIGDVDRAIATDADRERARELSGCLAPWRRTGG